MSRFASKSLFLMAVVLVLAMQQPARAEAKPNAAQRQASERIASGINGILEPVILSGIGG